MVIFLIKIITYMTRKWQINSKTILSLPK